MTDEERMQKMMEHVDRLDAIFDQHMRSYVKLKQQAGITAGLIFIAGVGLGVALCRMFT